jgi:hypothetical protein
MRKFRYLRSVKRSYLEQGRIFFSCANYARLPAAERRRIDALISRIGEEYAPALRALMVDGMPWQRVCTDYALSPKTLERVRRRFYESW